MDATVGDTKRSLDSHIDDNNKTIKAVKEDVKTAFADIESLKIDMQTLKENLTKAQQDRTKNKLDIASKDLKDKTVTLDKLDQKYVKDEELHMRCLLIVDGLKELKLIRFCHFWIWKISKTNVPSEH